MKELNIIKQEHVKGIKHVIKPNIRANGALRGNLFFELINQKLALITM